MVVSKAGSEVRWFGQGELDRRFRGSLIERQVELSQTQAELDQLKERVEELQKGFNDTKKWSDVIVNSTHVM
jgi:uncharacterized protein YlxW (UPF0749 family)